MVLAIESSSLNTFEYIFRRVLIGQRRLENDHTLLVIHLTIAIRWGLRNFVTSHFETIKLYPLSSILKRYSMRF